MRTLILPSLLLLLSGCTNQLQQVNKTLSDVNGALASLNGTSGTAAGQPSPAGGQAFPQPSPVQVEALNSQLRSPTPDQTLLATRQDASATIEKVIAFISCYPEWSPGRYLEPYLMPGASHNVLAPMNGMRYHPKDQCLKVARMDNWSMPARNALAFRTVYASDISGESKSFSYEVVRQLDGAWLFKRAGF
ncbi:hypothetical protein D9M70_268050 [compost metagenome]